MNALLERIETLVKENMPMALPDVRPEQLEGNGELFYMNGNNGTAFDWFVNGRLSYFMSFYDDAANLGAVKVGVFADGSASIWFFSHNGERLGKQENFNFVFSEKELLELAVILKNQADEKKIWDGGICKMDTDIKPSTEQVHEFLAQKEDYESSIQCRKTLGMYCYVSKKILKEGWKVGYMYREEANREQDSGWVFMAGNEEDKYLNDANNIQLMEVGQMTQIDPDVFPFVVSTPGSSFIRVSDTKFEPDDGKKKIYFMKRELITE